MTPIRACAAALVTPRTTAWPACSQHSASRGQRLGRPLAVVKTPLDRGEVPATSSREEPLPSGGATLTIARWCGGSCRAYPHRAQRVEAGVRQKARLLRMAFGRAREQSVSQIYRSTAGANHVEDDEWQIVPCGRVQNQGDATGKIQHQESDIHRTGTGANCFHRLWKPADKAETEAQPPQRFKQQRFHNSNLPRSPRARKATSRFSGPDRALTRTIHDGASRVGRIEPGKFFSLTQSP